MKAVGRAFPHLKRLRLNHQWLDIQVDEFKDIYQALGTACSMPELRHLQLFANQLCNNALAAILDNCLNLSLDLRQCFNIEMDAELQVKCASLKDVRLPKDSTKDYEYETFIEAPSLDSFQLPLAAAHPQCPIHGGSDEDSEDDDLDAPLGVSVTKYGFIIGDYDFHGQIVHDD